MSTLTGKVKNKIPSPIWEMTRMVWYGLIRVSQLPAATLHPWRRISIRNLSKYKNSHSGERGFIIGNGPSLKKTDLSRLRNEYTFGMNRIYLLFPDLGFTTTYYLSVNDLVIEQCVEDILSLQIPRFLSWRSRSYIRSALPKGGELPDNPPLTFVHTTYTGPKFAQDASHRLWEGATVTYTGLQLAFHMGFKQVILIGVDHNFTTKGKPNTTVISKGDDPDHFDKNYFGKGFRWQLPDLDTSERAYHMARTAYLDAGREILDASIDGKLTVFPKVDYDSLF